MWPFPTNEITKPHVKIILSYNGKQYIVREPYKDEDNPYYLWEDGNFGCDCNRSLFIQRQCKEDFPAMDCGTDIDLLAIEIVE